MEKTHPAPPWLRIAGTHIPAHEVLASAASVLAALGVEVVLPGTPPSHDYAQVDPALDISNEPAEPPQTATGYAGLSPAQRGAYQQWATTPGSTAPLAFRQLYAANLETWLLEQFSDDANANPALLHAHLLNLLESPFWRRDDLLPRILLLDARLHDSASAFHNVTTSGLLTPTLLTAALGMQALLPTPLPLSAEQVLVLAKAWRIDTYGVDQQLLALRLSYLTNQLHAEPLQHALAEIHRVEQPNARYNEIRTSPSPDGEGRGEVQYGVQPASTPSPTSRTPQPWRTSHRDLRLAMPQPDLRPLLEPLLATLFTQIDVAIQNVPPTPTTTSVATTKPSPEPPARNGRVTKAKNTGRQEWALVLEFGESRSQYYTFALELAQREQNYQPLLDERRQIIHRVHYRKSEMRRFWRLWDYVQTWSNSRVYVNGNELEKWQIWPWSQYLR